MKRLFLFVMAAVLIWPLQAQKLRFNGKGEFKIVQFTDLHYQSENPRAKAALCCMEEVITVENPDLVILTGDNIYSKPADVAMQHILDCLDAKKVPYVLLFGNHDEEQGMTHAQLYDIICTGKYNIQPDRGEVASPDYVLEVVSSDGTKPSALLYCLDSHSYPKKKGWGQYAWLTFDQVSWYRQQSQAYTAKAGGKPLPALAFLHIPLPEYALGAANERTIMHGTRMEAACCPNFNTGFFTAAMEQGDIMGFFCGHDHDNDYSLMYQHILLAYGRFSGGNTEYNHLPRGARVIVLKEGKRTFDTWIRQADGKQVWPTTYPTSYVKDNWRTRKD